MTMRYLFLFLLSVTLLGCQFQAQQPDPALLVTPTPDPAPAVAATPSATTPGSNPQPTDPPPTVLQADPTEPAATAEQCSVYPPESAAVVQENDSADSIPEVRTEPVWSYRIVNTYPHDIGAFTQGLVIEDNVSTLLEGTGNDSSLRRVDLLSGEIQQNFDIADEYFGEGVTKFGDRIIQLTWTQETGFVYDQETFEQIDVFSYPHQGWGITHDDEHLIVSDGSDIIRFWDPETFQEVRRIQVAGENGPVTQLNELEYVEGEIWANVWHTDVIVRISPEDGRVLGWIDLAGLMSLYLRTDPQAVLNGIAYDEQSCRLFVTGKLWPALFEIELVNPGDL